MAHIVYTGTNCRLELNLDERDEAAVGEFLLGLVQQHTLEGLLPVSRHTVRVPEAEVAPGTDSPGAGVPPSEGVAPPRKGRRAADAENLRGSRTTSAVRCSPPPPPRQQLPEQVCARDGCDTVFQPTKLTNRFCSTRCRKATSNAARAARERKSAGTGQFACPEAGCDRTFDTAQGVGGHRAKAHPGAKAAAAPENLDTRYKKVGRPAGQGSDIPRNNIGPKVTPPEDRPFKCKACGHPCRSRGELDTHRLAYHDADPLPKTVAVIDAMEFPCPHDGCSRVYDDENRLNHHLWVIHDTTGPGSAEERVVLSDSEIVSGLAAGTVRAVKVG